MSNSLGSINWHRKKPRQITQYWALNAKLQDYWGTLTMIPRENNHCPGLWSCLNNKTAKHTSHTIGKLKKLRTYNVAVYNFKFGNVKIFLHIQHSIFWNLRLKFAQLSGLTREGGVWLSLLRFHQIVIDEFNNILWIMGIQLLYFHFLGFPKSMTSFTTR